MSVSKLTQLQTFRGRSCPVQPVWSAGHWAAPPRYHQAACFFSFHSVSAFLVLLTPNISNSVIWVWISHFLTHISVHTCGNNWDSLYSMWMWLMLLHFPYYKSSVFAYCCVCFRGTKLLESYLLNFFLLFKFFYPFLFLFLFFLLFLFVLVLMFRFRLIQV